MTTVSGSAYSYAVALPIFTAYPECSRTRRARVGGKASARCVSRGTLHVISFDDIVAHTCG